MGGGNSVANINRNLTESVVNTATNSIQSVANKTIQSQELIVDCNDPGRLEAVRACLDQFKDRSDDSIQKICGTLYGCGANHIDMSALLNVNIDSQQIQSAAQDFQKKIRSSIEESAKQDNGILTIGNSTKNVIDSTVRTISTNCLDLFQGFNPTMEQTQRLNTKGGIISVVTLSTASDQVYHNIQNNSAIQKAIEELSTEIKQVADQQNGGNLLKILMIIIATVIGLLIILGVVLWIMKKRRSNNSNNTSDTTTSDYRPASDSIVSGTGMTRRASRVRPRSVARSRFA